MSVKEQIVKKLEGIYEPGEVKAGRIYKRYDYDGGRSVNGWWFKPFAGQSLYLGRSRKEAFEVIENIKEGCEQRQDDLAAERGNF